MARDTLTKQAQRARAKSLGALGLFRSAASELEAAEEQHRKVAQTAALESQRLANIQEEHDQQAAEAGTAATKLRALVGGASA